MDSVTEIISKAQYLVAVAFGMGLGLVGLAGFVLCLGVVVEE